MGVRRSRRQSELSLREHPPGHGNGERVAEQVSFDGVRVASERKRK
jgi:hypothetical protein